MRFLIIASLYIVVNAVSKCPPGIGGIGQLSNAPFWKGIDGATYIEELTDATHNQYVQKNPKVFVMYYATWCGYSKRARAGFGGAAKELNTKFKFAAVDCDQAKTTCNQGKHPVNGYPSFYLYKSGLWNEEYNGDTTKNEFVSYLSGK